MSSSDLLPIGRVVKAHGVRGKIKVKYFGENPHLFPYREIFIKDRAGKSVSYEILEAVSQPPRIILKVKGVERAEDAQALAGKEVLIRKETLPDLLEDEYYWAEILEMVVETEEGKKIGRMKEILDTGASDVWVIEGKKGEILLPATKEVIRSVDRKSGVIRVRWMEGLWEKEDEV
jgi:16S rRNA processing protein RimM